MGQRSLDLIEAMHTIIAAAQPITGRGVGYKLFTAGLIPSMARSEMQRVYRLLKEARERAIILWEWIVDESHKLERVSSSDDPEEYARAVIQSYRRDYWNQQPVRVEVWSEKGTIRGVLSPVLDEYGVGFRVMHGFGSATEVYNIAQNDDGRPLIALYVGDWDPSGLFMSDRTCPKDFQDTTASMWFSNALLSRKANCAASPPSRRPIRKRTRDTSGSSKTSAPAAGSWMRSIPMSCAPVSKRKF